MVNQNILTIIHEHMDKGSGPYTLKNYLLKQGFPKKEIEDALAHVKHIKAHHLNPRPHHEKVHMDRYVNKFLTVGIVIFLIIVILFGIYMTYFG